MPEPDQQPDPHHSRGGHWRCRLVDPAGRPVALALVRSAAHADGVLVDTAVASGEAVDAALPPGTVGVARHSREGGDVGDIGGLTVTGLAGPAAPPLWFVELREPASHPPAVHLMAFTGLGIAPGALLDADAAGEAGVGSSDQLGAVRWYPSTGEVDQIYVAPAARRRSIGSALIMAVATLSAARDWARLWGDGQRTELGEAWRGGQIWRDRAAPLTHLAPPMTPGGG